MANNASFLVIRLHPDSPVDGATFGNYLQGLQIKVYPAGADQTVTIPLGETTIVPGSLNLTQIPGLSQGYVSAVSQTVSTGTAQSGGNYGTTLDLDHADGVAIGATVAYAPDPKLLGANLTVTSVASPPTTPTVNLSGNIPHYIGSGASVTFYFQYGPGSVSISVNWSGATPSFSLQAKTSAKATNTKTVKLASTTGIAVGMTAMPASGIPAGTTVLAADSTTLTLSNPVNLNNNTNVTFTCSLSTDIVQHVEPLTDPIFTGYIAIPASVATAIIPIQTPPANSYLDISVVATRNGIPIPVDGDFYNVIVDSAAQLPTPDLFQSIPLQDTSLYITLPPPPPAAAIPLTVPSDGTPPAFDGVDGLLPAMKQALTNDPFFPASTDITTLTAHQCSRLAYDIVWSQQNALPLPPDPLETLYTNPPNSGSSGGGGGTDEQDRQHFEGTLNSFYATRNATAQRLAKFVYAAAAAVWCEEQSLAATQALLAFPVKPGQANTASVGQAQVILTGIGNGRPPNNIHFGVPAAFFYALHANLAPQVTAQQRYQMACGDTIDRVLADLSNAVVAKTIADSASFVSPSAPAGSPTSAQAARRIAALGVSPASPTPFAPLGTIAAQVTADTAASGTSLTLGSTSGIVSGMLVSGSGIAVGTTVNGVPTATSVPLSAGVSSVVAQGTPVVFTPPFGTELKTMVQDWLDYSPPASNSTPSSAVYQPSDDEQKLWPKVASNRPTAFLEHFLSALTQNYIIPPPINATLGAKIEQWLPTLMVPHGPAKADVTTLAQVSATQWTTFFQGPPGDPSWLPPFTLPGSTTVRIAAFVRYVQKFFDMPAPNPPTLVAPTPGSPQGLGLPSQDWLQNCVTAYQTATGQTLTFGKGFDATQMAAAAATVFTNDPAAQAWAVEALQAIDQLTLMANGVTTAPPPAVTPNANTRFAIMEALYARGFTRVQQVQDLTSDQFAEALTGTFAYDYAAQLYAAAQGNKQPAGPGPGILTPVNPDGSLTNCVPPPCRSPLGPIAYLRDLIQVSEASTCANPKAPSASGRSTLGAVIAKRRGDIGTLAATCANLETPLPLIDLVNECLEFMGSVAPPATNGIVYDTNADSLAKHVLCKEECCPPENETRGCHDPATIFAALPEHSTPATPTSSNSAVEPAVYNNLKVDFSSCCLPYSQALDMSRTYLRHFRTNRFEEMRSFRKCITEFVLEPDNEPTGFQSYLWRYPVRIDTAIEYLGITPEEYRLLFQGSPAPPCAPVEDRPRGDGTTTAVPAAPGSTTTAPTPAAPTGAAAVTPAPGVAASAPAAAAPATGNMPPAAPSAPAGPAVASLNGPTPWQLYGFASQTVNDPPWPRGTPWTTVITDLGQFLARTCLTYCEFLELQQSGFVTLRNRGTEDGTFPDCPPCYLDKTILDFGSGEDVAATLARIAIFIRLWRALKRTCKGYSFAQLRDICDVLHLFNGTVLNPDFIRQLAAFQMLRDHFGLELANPDAKPSATAIDADRTHLLALWAPNAAKWIWAIRQLVHCVERYASRRHECERRSPKFVELMLSNLDPLSHLAGFDPASATDSWHASPTRTLRFAEVLAKIYASDFRMSEIFYIFTVDQNLYGDSPFPLQENNEALGSPLDLPEDQHEHSLWHLRRKLIEVEVTDEDAEEWGWKRIKAELQNFFGFADQDVLAMGAHFFPHVLERAGYQVDGKSTRFFSSLHKANTDPQMWTAPPDGPFQYDPNAEQLSTAVPLVDEAVIAKLTHVHALGAEEMTAVQDLYFQPRAMLAEFALLFSDFPVAEKHMIEGRGDEDRWHYFRRQFVRCHRRCRIIAEHLSRHVALATGQECPAGETPAQLILRELFADENKLLATTTDPNPDWENDDGTHPGVTWTPPNGGAFAALLALVGTGLVAEYKPAGGAVIWRNVCGPLSAFGRERDRENCPVPAVLPSMAATIPSSQQQFVSVLNGFLMKNGTSAPLGGAQGFDVSWSGALLVDHEGTYEFCAGAPTPDGEMPNFEAAEHRKWRVTLKRGQRTWVLLTHLWPGEIERGFGSLTLRRGAYDLTVEFTQPSPDFQNEQQVRPQRTGFQVKYSGPDSHGQRVAIPHDRLFCVHKEQTFADGLTDLAPAATTFLGELYVGSLRDIRRTYQRAFKALLFAHRFALSAAHRPHDHCELAYMLGQAAKFAGNAFYRGGGAFVLHAANFDFNYLPVYDDYYPPTQDARAHPSAQRSQAMFDWWERLFDYAAVRRDVRRCCGRHLWHLFDEALQKKPADPGYLLRDMGAVSPHRHAELRYYQAQNSKIYAATSVDLEDDRWVVRAWHADRWLHVLQPCRDRKDIAAARPDLWASDDPSALVLSETETGNANLSAFLCDSSLEDGKPRRYEDVERLNDGLRERGREALVAYLCRMNRVTLPWAPGTASTARDLTDLLLIDVEAGLCERASRIEEAITAVQNFVRRARLGLEPSWTVTHEFALMWERRFATFHVWEACQRRELYKENWVEWGELEKARCIEAFRFLESELRRNTLTVARPGGGEWWPDQRAPAHPGMPALQERDPSDMSLIAPAREGLGLSGQPERAARPSWLALPSAPSQGGGSASTPALPFWMGAAIRRGQRFCRVAAAGAPPAASAFHPHSHHGEPACCAECGRIHPPLVDEYYFWLVDAPQYSEPENNGQIDGGPTAGNSYEVGFQADYYSSKEQHAVPWQVPAQLPTLLAWQPGPAVRLAWCRVHNGEFQQPRRSVESVGITTGTSADLIFAGRQADSLTFQVTNGVVPTGYASPDDPNPDPTPPGFRYDIAGDVAVSLPLLVKPLVPSTYLGAFPAYPFFAYVAPGAPLFPCSPFAPALAVAWTLRAHCRFEAALRWYRLAFDPFANDCTWVDCPNDWRRNPNSAGGATTPAPATDPATGAVGAPPTAVNVPAPEPCCQSTGVTDDVARNRSILLHYIETLLEWHAALMRRHSPESFQQARLVLDTARKILGPRPYTVCAEDVPSTQKVSDFKPDFAPLNPRLLDAYDRVADGLELVHHCLDAWRLRNGLARCDMPYFGDDPFREGWRSTIETCPDEAEWCHLHSPYRFVFLVQKAQELAGKVRELGSALLAAFEKGDAEYLASLRAGHEREVLELGLASRQDQWRDADWQIEALQKTKEISQANLGYHNNLIQAGLIDDESQYQILTAVSMVARAAGNITEAIGEALKPVPDFYVGFPCEESHIPSGTKLSGMFESAARIINVGADIANTTAGLDLTEAGWLRRAVEWVHQAQIHEIEIQQIERQILGAQRRRDQALHDVNMHRRQMEQSAEAQDFLRDKFTAHDLYLWHQKESAALCFRMYELALRAARQAEHAYNFERGHTTQRFVPEECWDDLHEGLLAGERLESALHRMEKAYLDRNVREYELTKHFSLRLHFPMAYLRLRTTGCCEIDLPEWMFDLDHPGHHTRRIKNVTLTIPCQTGPYTGVHCRLTLLSSMTRIDPRLPPPVHRCCENGHRCDYETCAEDPRVVRQYAAREAIATSSGQNDSGMFELNFRDERYLPFEFLGAVSRWRIELPPENNCFDFETLSDLVLHLNYMAREGGTMLRRAASEAAECRLREGRWSFFDVRHEFPDAWQLFRDRDRQHDYGRDGDHDHDRNHIDQEVDRGRDYDHDRGPDRYRERDDDDHREHDHDRGHEHERDRRHERERDEDDHRDRDRRHDDHDRDRGREYARDRGPDRYRERDDDDHREHDHDRGHEHDRDRRHEHERDDNDQRDRGQNRGRDDDHERDGDRDHDRRRDPGRALGVRLGRNMFPFIPGSRKINVTGVVLMFETDGRCGRDCCEVEFAPDEEERTDHENRSDGVKLRCVKSCDWPRLYHGAADVDVGPLGGSDHHRHATFWFPRGVGRIERVFLFWRYRASALDAACCEVGQDRLERRHERRDGERA